MRFIMPMPLYLATPWNQLWRTLIKNNSKFLCLNVLNTWTTAENPNKKTLKPPKTSSAFYFPIYITLSSVHKLGFQNPSGSTTDFSSGPFLLSFSLFRPFPPLIMQYISKWPSWFYSDKLHFQCTFYTITALPRVNRVLHLSNKTSKEPIYTYSPL